MENLGDLSAIFPLRRAGSTILLRPFRALALPLSLTYLTDSVESGAGREREEKIRREKQMICERTSPWPRLFLQLRSALARPLNYRRIQSELYVCLSPLSAEPR